MGEGRVLPCPECDSTSISTLSNRPGWYYCDDCTHRFHRSDTEPREPKGDTPLTLGVDDDALAAAADALDGGGD